MDGGVMELSGELRAGGAAALRDRLHEALRNGDLRLSVAALTGVDCATVQVLVAAARTAARLDRNLQVEGLSEGALGAMLDRLAIGPLDPGRDGRTG